MQSVKNTAVTIVLLFLSYGVYQVITKPLPSEHGDLDPMPFSVIDSTPENEVVADNLSLPPTGQSDNRLEFERSSQEIPPQLLELDIPDSMSFTADTQPPAQNKQPQPPRYPDLHLDPPTQSTTANNTDFASRNSPFEIDKAQQSSIESPVAQANFPTDAPENNQTISYDVQYESTGASQFESDSRIIPSTVMANVAEKPVNPASSQPVAAAPRTLADSWQSITNMVEQEDFSEALFVLSGFYRDNNYQPEQFNQLVDWLDALAAKVIYSSESHIHSRPYIIQPGDTIGSLARKWQIPAQLIYNVNTRRIPDHTNLPIGEEIKMIEGPFDAVIDSEAGLMTLYLDEMYAGRFAVKTPMPLSPAEVRITDKSAQDQIDRPYWIALSNGGSIVASDDIPSREIELGMNLQEAEEIFSILSAGSRIRILR